MEGTSRPEIEFRITQDQVFRSVSLPQIYLHIRTKEVSKHNTITWISENAIVFYGRLLLFFSLDIMQTINYLEIHYCFQQS